MRNQVRMVWRNGYWIVQCEDLNIEMVFENMDEAIEAKIFVLQNDVSAALHEANGMPAAAADDARHAGRRAID